MLLMLLHCTPSPDTEHELLDKGMDIYISRQKASRDMPVPSSTIVETYNKRYLAVAMTKDIVLYCIAS